MPVAAAQDAVIVPIVRRAPPLPVSPAMMLAGKQAFLAHRGRLDDLHYYFDDDLAHFLRQIYRAMAGSK